MNAEEKAVEGVDAPRHVRCSSFSLVKVMDYWGESLHRKRGRTSLQARILRNKILILRLKLLQFRLDFLYSRFQLRSVGFKFIPATFAALLEAVRLYLGRYLGYDVVNVFKSSHSIVLVKGKNTKSEIPTNVEAWHPLPGAPLRFRLRFLLTLGLRLGAGSGLTSAGLCVPSMGTL